MLAIILALASAVVYGGSDFAAGLASRTASVIQVTLLATVAAAAVVLAALPFAASRSPSGAALGWGAAAGTGGTLGAFALYLGFRYAAFSVAGPLSAVGTAGFSVLAGLLWGERPSTMALIGAAELAVAVAVAAVTRNLRLPWARPGWLAVITGVAGAAGTIMYFFASHDGFLAVTAVLTSLYPASTIVLARTLLGERLTGLRLTGLALAAVCVALIAAGGAG